MTDEDGKEQVDEEDVIEEVRIVGGVETDTGWDGSEREKEKDGDKIRDDEERTEETE